MSHHPSLQSWLLTRVQERDRKRSFCHKEMISLHVKCVHYRWLKSFHSPFKFKFYLLYTVHKVKKQQEETPGSGAFLCKVPSKMFARCKLWILRKRSELQEKCQNFTFISHVIWVYSSKLWDKSLSCEIKSCSYLLHLFIFVVWQKLFKYKKY